MSEENSNGGILFNMPKNKSNVIKVIGVGGGGGNAINHMFKSGIVGVDFVLCNTDAQALANSPIPVTNKIQLGVSLTEGLGAGADPEVGEASAKESLEALTEIFDEHTKMVFITAGMGGGTGTGAAPIIAKMAKEAGVLTVGIVTVPFEFEGIRRNKQAQAGIQKLRSAVDSLIIVNNNKLREAYGNLGFKAGFAKADEVLATAAKSIAEVITNHYLQNIDLRDARTVLENGGSAIMGSAVASGQNRAQEAIRKAMDSPLLDDNKITGAKKVLLLIQSGDQEITMDEIGEISEYIQDQAGGCADIIQGIGEDDALVDGAIYVTIVATGFEVSQQDSITNSEVKKKIHVLGDEQPVTQVLSAKDVSTQIQLPKKTTEDLARNTTRNQLVKEFKVDHKIQPIETITPAPVEQEKAPEVADKSEAKPCEPVTVSLDLFNDISHNEVESEPIQFVINEEPSETEFSQETIEGKVEETPIEEPINKESQPTITGTITNDVIETSVPTQETIVAADDFVIVDENPNVAVPQMKLEKVEDQHFSKQQNETNYDEMRLRESQKRSLYLKQFNHNFGGRFDNIDELENTPAYLRQKVDISGEDEDIKLSNTRLSKDSNDDDQLRSDNSFLHSNPD